MCVCLLNVFLVRSFVLFVYIVQLVLPVTIITVCSMCTSVYVCVWVFHFAFSRLFICWFLFNCVCCVFLCLFGCSVVLVCCLHCSVSVRFRRVGLFVLTLAFYHCLFVAVFGLY